MSKKLLTNLDMSLNEIQNAKFHLLATEPSTGSEGQYYFNTTDHKLYYHNGTQWKAIGAGAVTSVDAKSGEYVVAVNNDDPTQPKIYFNFSATQGDGVTLSQQNDGLKVEVQDATNALKGITMLSDTPSATEDTKAATPKGANVTLVEQATAEEGYLKTYVVSQGGVEVGKINIPKDFLVKSATTDTVKQADIEAGGKFEDRTKYAEFLVGDYYIDFTINVKEGTATDEHLYLLCKKLGAFTQVATATMATTETSKSIALPINSKFVSAEMLDADGDIVGCDIKVSAATSTTAGSVTFSIASAYSEELTCQIAYIG